MSKEFEGCCSACGSEDATWELGVDPDAYIERIHTEAFTAGRALGRREVKGEAKEACRAAVTAPHLKIIGEAFAEAIEAISEATK